MNIQPENVPDTQEKEPKNLNLNEPNDDKKKSSTTPTKPIELKTPTGKTRKEILQEMSELRKQIEENQEKGRQAALDKLKRISIQQKKSMETIDISTLRDDLPIDGDLVNGSRVFMRNCAGCHTLDSNNQGRRSVGGPPLGLIYGRKVGSDKYFEYSNDYLQSTRYWTARNLFNYIRNPQRFFPDSKCKIKDGGVIDESERIDLVKFLKSFTKNLKINIDLKNRMQFGDDYVDQHNKSYTKFNQQTFKRYASDE